MKWIFKYNFLYMISLYEETNIIWEHTWNTIKENSIISELGHRYNKMHLPWCASPTTMIWSFSLGLG